VGHEHEVVGGKNNNRVLASVQEFSFLFFGQKKTNLGFLEQAIPLRIILDPKSTSDLLDD
jgi:hypothetical protein